MVVGVGPPLAKADQVGHLAITAVPESVIDLCMSSCVVCCKVWMSRRVGTGAFSVCFRSHSTPSLPAHAYTWLAPNAR